MARAGQRIQCGLWELTKRYCGNQGGLGWLRGGDSDVQCGSAGPFSPCLTSWRVGVSPPSMAGGLDQPGKQEGS